jgi:predicted PurR-regulated permease PerM
MRRPLRIDISSATIVRVLAAVVGVWVWLRLWQWVLLFVVGAFLAVGLDPLVSWLDAHRLRRRYAAPLVVILIASLLIAFAYLAASSLTEQAGLLGNQLEQARQAFVRRAPAPVLEVLQKGDSALQLGSYVMGFVPGLLNALLSIGVAFVLTIYLLLDGRRTWEWIIAFAPPRERPRIRQTADEARLAAVAYVRGNVTTSVLAAICTYAAMVLLHVPGALLLAVLAGILDLIPVLGIIFSTVPAVLLGLTVSIWTAVGVVIYHACYNVVENYYITPKVYGHELRLSSLAVITAFAVGAELGGVIGALVSLPIAAMYPAIERIWLGDRIGPATVKAHQRIEKSAEH